MAVVRRLLLYFFNSRQAAGSVTSPDRAGAVNLAVRSPPGNGHSDGLVSRLARPFGLSAFGHRNRPALEGRIGTDHIPSEKRESLSGEEEPVPTHGPSPSE
jgi:hypothetical protein